MIHAVGDMWSVFEEVDLFLITANAAIKRNGALVMGRGIAREARDRFPGLDGILGRWIADTVGPESRYNLLISPRWPKARLGLFQVKFHWKESADITLISEGVDDLIEWCSDNPGKEVALNYPGIGNGRVHPMQVAPFVNKLPDCVTLWTKKPLPQPGGSQLGWEHQRAEDQVPPIGE